MNYLRILVYALLTLSTAALKAQSSASGPQPAQAGAPPSAVDDALPTPSSSGPAPKVDNPYDAYTKGLYDQALQGFTDLQVDRPEDPALMLNIAFPKSA